MNYPYIYIQLIDGEIKVVVNKEAKPIHNPLEEYKWQQNHEVFEFANPHEEGKIMRCIGGMNPQIKYGLEVNCIEIKDGLAWFKYENNKMEKSAMQLLKERLFDVRIRQNPITYDEINGFIELEKKQLIELSKHLRKYYEPITQNNYEWKNIRENKIYHIDEIINELHNQI